MGSLPELVTPEAGKVVPYGGSPWKLETPDIPGLASAAVQMLAEFPISGRCAGEGRVRVWAGFDGG